MGPTILLDKSALQAIGKRGIYELMRYFYVTIPPVLPLEILADLEKKRRKETSPAEEVGKLAEKLCANGGGFVNVDFQRACLSELLGGPVPMERKPVVTGARPLATADGHTGLYLPCQPEKVAALRWSMGQFSEADRRTAAQWRRTLQSFDPECLRRSLPPLVKTATSLRDADRDVERLLDDVEGAQLLVRWLIQFIAPASARAVVEEWTFRRWERLGLGPLSAFAPYSRHCLKVTLLFCLGFANGLISTRRSNWVDAQYLYYTPFAQVLCSRDKLHQQLASFILGNDQSFVFGDMLVDELHALANRRRNIATEIHDGDRGCADAVEPADGSCVHNLTVRHLGAFRPRSPRASALSEDERKRLMDEVAPIVEAIRRDSKKVRDRPWPA